MTSTFTATVDPAPMVAIGALSGKSALWPPKRSEEPNTRAARADSTDRWRKERITVYPFRRNEDRFGLNSSILDTPEKQKSTVFIWIPRYQLVAPTNHEKPRTRNFASLPATNPLPIP